MIKYEITLHPEQHIYRVTLNFIATTSNHKLYLPTWIPGSYMIREFSKNIIDIVASCDNKLIEIAQINKNEWLISNLTETMKISVVYNVYAYEYGIRTAFLDTTRGYFNPTSLCLAVAGCEEEKHGLTIIGLLPNWSIATGLHNLSNGIYVAKNYDELVDCPVEIGNLKVHRFDVNNTAHYLVLSGTILPFDVQRILEDMHKICEYQINMFGGVAPYNNYTFILNLNGEVYTGLEHRNSTLLMAPYYALPNLNKTNEDDYIKLMGLISHEFFHTWNVKRIKPQAFTPYNLYQENYTKLLWWFEGVTSYYDDLVMYRSGIIDQQTYLTFIVNNLNNVYKFNGVTKQSVANSSLTAWVKYYRQDENSPNSIVSYYVKGSLIALGLDLLIRNQSQYSLDDVLRYMFKRWQDNSNGIAEDDIPHLIKAATGVDLSDFIQLATETTANIDFNYILAKFGLELRQKIAVNHQATGCYYPHQDTLIEDKAVIDLGVKLEKQALGYVVKIVYTDTVASNAGLAANDLIIALDGIKLTNIDRQLAFYKPGETVTLAILRQDRLFTLTLTLSLSKVQIFNLHLVDANMLIRWL